MKKYKKLELPAKATDRPEQIVEHLGYAASYNSRTKLPNWVAYELTMHEVKGNSKRNNRFVQDPKSRQGQASNADYTRSGYDRGHMAPAADMTWDKQAMEESFYFTNICPQTPELNRGIWKSLEDKERDWAKKDSAILIVCGPILSKKIKSIELNKVAVPDQFYKVIMRPFGKKPKAIGFLFKNEGSNEKLQKFAVSVDSIQKLTGIDFFYQLPQPLQTEVERTYNLNDWF